MPVAETTPDQQDPTGHGPDSGGQSTRTPATRSLRFKATPPAHPDTAASAIRHTAGHRHPAPEQARTPPTRFQEERQQQARQTAGHHQRQPPSPSLGHPPNPEQPGVAPRTLTIFIPDRCPPLARRPKADLHAYSGSPPTSPPPIAPSPHPGYPLRLKSRGVAQLGSAPYWGCGGRWFESSRPDSTNDNTPLESPVACCHFHPRKAPRPATQPNRFSTTTSLKAN